MKTFVAVIALSLMLWTCNASQDPYGVASKGSDDVATAINQIETQVDQLRVQGGISTAEEKSILAYANFANTQNGVFQTCIGTAHTSGNTVPSYVACAQAELTALNNPTQLALLHVSDPASQTKVESIIGTISLAINTVITSLNAIKSSPASKPAATGAIL